MEIRKIAIYSLFGLVVIYGFYFHFFSGEGTINRGKSHTPVMESSASANRTAAAGSMVRTTEIPPASPEIIVKKWKKDPFFNRRNYKTNSSVTRLDKPDNANKPRLSAISRANGTRMAVVNGRVLRIGDSVGVWRLDKIASKAARLKGPDGSIWIKLGG